MRLMIILGSSRQGRKGEAAALWAKKQVGRDARFELDYVDNRELNLPFFNEPLSPFTMAREGQEYMHPEGRAWANRVAQAEAVIIITAEYNHGYPGVLKNTLDWVGPEWGDKPVGFISYSSNITGGARAVEQLRPVVTELGMIQVANAIHIPKIAEAFNPDGTPVFEGLNDNLKKMCDELIRLRTAIKK